MESQGFRGVPGVPEGWELVGFWQAKKGEHCIDGEGHVIQSSVDLCAVWPIIRKIEEPAKYRPFASAEEFKPHRDRWWYRDDNSGRIWFPPQPYNDTSHGGATYKYRFETCFFEDGTPFGVKIDGN